MIYRERLSIERLPGNPDATTFTLREWVCPECDFFEEAEPRGPEPSE